LPFCIAFPNSSGFIYFSGGRSPYTLSVRGHDFYFENGLQEITIESRFGTFARVYTGEEACGGSIITVSDGCTSVVGYIRTTVGSWSIVIGIFPFNYWLSHWFGSGVYVPYYTVPGETHRWLDHEYYVSTSQGGSPNLNLEGTPFTYWMAYNSPATWAPSCPATEAPTRNFFGHDMILFDYCSYAYPDASGYITSHQTEYRYIHKFHC